MEEIEGGNEAVAGNRSGGGWLRAVVLAAAIGGRMERRGWSAHGG